MPTFIDIKYPEAFWKSIVVLVAFQKNSALPLCYSVLCARYFSTGVF